MLVIILIVGAFKLSGAVMAVHEVFSSVNADDLMTVHSIRALGPCPIGSGDCQISVSRTIHQAFTASWRVNLLDHNGLPVAGCSGSGINIYTPEAEVSFVQPLFGWWMETDPCELAPGQYNVATHWRIHQQDNGSPLDIFALSDPIEFE